jgi:hypothetical protein
MTDGFRVGAVKSQRHRRECFTLGTGHGVHKATSLFRESRGSITVENYLEPLQAKLRATYQLDY